MMQNINCGVFTVHSSKPQLIKITWLITYIVCVIKCRLITYLINYGENCEHRSCGATDNASDYGSEDSRFESWQDRQVINTYSTGDVVFFCWSSKQTKTHKTPLFSSFWHWNYVTKSIVNLFLDIIYKLCFFFHYFLHTLCVFFTL